MGNLRYSSQISKLRESGFNPIAVTTMMFEDTFVFETEQEAENAFNKLEKNCKDEESLQGWYYGWDRFVKSIDEHKKQFGFIEDIFYLGEKPKIDVLR